LRFVNDVVDRKNVMKRASEVEEREEARSVVLFYNCKSVKANAIHQKDKKSFHAKNDWQEFESLNFLSFNISLMNSCHLLIACSIRSVWSLGKQQIREFGIVLTGGTHFFSGWDFWMYS